MIRFTCLLFLVFLLMFMSFGTINAQECHTSQKRAERLKINPQLKDNIAKIQSYTEEWILQNQSKSQRELITLPIVIHVIYQNAEENISEEQILSQVPVLNEGFRMRNSNFGDTPNAFQGLAADVEIEFCMASMDPSGQSTNGITRTRTDVKDIGDTEDWYADDTGGKSAWNGDEYINIWVCNIGGGTLGFASPPGTADPIESDGMVIDYRFFGTSGVAADNSPNHLGTTVTHEMGHYFNLEHMWGPEEGGCNEDDFVDDTPPQFTESAECPRYPYFDDCSSDGDGIMFMNYMDYSDDACMTMFTEGQKMRMLAAVNGPRVSLLNSSACALATSTIDFSFFENSLNVFPNPAQNEVNISIEDDSYSGVLIFDILDLTGKRVHSFEYKKGIAVNVSFVESGTYLLTSKSYPTAGRKFVILK